MPVTGKKRFRLSMIIFNVPFEQILSHNTYKFEVSIDLSCSTVSSCPVAPPPVCALGAFSERVEFLKEKRL